MTFLNAWAFGFAAIAPVIVLLYLLKLKRRTLPVSTLIFWQRVLQESRRRALFQRLRHWLSLLLHLLIFALILGALLRPTLDHFIRDGASTVLIIDTRARMQALEPDGRTRFAKTRALALGFIRQASAQHQIAIISAQAEPAVVSAFREDESALRASLDALAPTDAGGELTPAIHLAEELLAARQGTHRILVLTDSPPATPLSTLNSQLSFLPVGSARDNVAIIRFATRPQPNSPQTSEVLLEIANFGREVARGEVEFAFDGHLLDVKSFALEPGARKVEIFPTVPRPAAQARGWLTARLQRPDALALDNVAFAVLPTTAPRRVLLVTKGNWFLEKLLAAEQSLAIELLDPSVFQLAQAEKFDAVVLDNFLPAGLDLTVTPGNFFFIKQTPFAESEAVLAQPIISETDATHPALRLVNLQNVTVVRASALALPTAEGWSWQAPIRSPDHPLMITGSRRGPRAQRVAALAFDVADSDLPLRIAFPLLISNTLHWLTGDPAAEISSAVVGETIALAENETLNTEPQSPWSAVPKPISGQIVREFFQPLRTGYYRLTRPDGEGWLAVNTFSEAESDLRTASSSPAPSSALPTIAMATFSTWPLWQYLALAAFALLALEWWLFHRRRTE